MRAVPQRACEALIGRFRYDIQSRCHIREDDGAIGGRFSHTAIGGKDDVRLTLAEKQDVAVDRDP